MSDIEASFGITFPLQYGENSLVGHVELITTTKIRLEYWIEWLYWDFFDLYIPWIVDKCFYDESVIYEQSQDVLTGQTIDTPSEDIFPNTAVTDDISPSLHCGFEDLGADSYEFWTNYYDPNLKEPDTTYGVKLHLIDLDGIALSSLDMIEQVDPDYSSINGVNFTRTVDLSSYDEGLWHYYFSTKDKDIGEIVTYPIDDYLVGPDTSNAPLYLISQHVSGGVSSTGETEGWLSEDFDFYVTWWDMIDNNAPSKVYLCLVPAVSDISTGKSKTVGIQKFEMSTVEGSPNYNECVDYQYTYNFGNAGYTDSNIGCFKYYFEAETSFGDFVLLLSSDIETENNHFGGVYVKSISELNFILNTYSTDGDDDILTSENMLYYTVVVSDWSGDGLSEKPTIIFTKGEDNEEFEMLHYRTLDDGKTKKYYFLINNTKLSAGYWHVDFYFEYNEVEYTLDDGVVLDSSFIEKFMAHSDKFNLDFSFGVDTSIALNGILPMALLNIVLMSTIGTQNAYVLLGGVATIVVMLAQMVLLLNMYWENNQIGQLYGWAFGCLILYICYSQCVKVDNVSGQISPLHYILGMIYGHIKTFFALQLIYQLMAPFLSNMFRDSVGFMFFDGLLIAFPMFIGFYVLIQSLLGGLFFVTSMVKLLGGTVSSLGWPWKVYARCLQFYEVMLMVGMLAGFIMGSVKLGFWINDELST